MREIYIFVGENRSKTAKENGYSWQGCQQTGKPVLAMKPLWEALEEIGLDPRAQVFFNLWDDGWNPNELIPEILMEFIDSGEIVVGMGRNVQKALRELNIPHREMYHPAARGKIRRSDLYRKHVKEVLSY